MISTSLPGQTMTDSRRGLVFDIQGFSVHDGPGCRTLVFLGGCPLRCAWCANPEGAGSKPQLLYRRSRCNCRTQGCKSACPHGAISNDSAGGIVIDRKFCESCEDPICIRSCYQEALVLCGSMMNAQEVVGIIKRDSFFWGDDGGITLGGGDPVAQPEFAEEILATCQAEGIHTAIETSACAAADRFLSLMQHVRFAFIDVKHMNPQDHISGTGVDNRAILANIRALSCSNWNGRLVIRIPLIPGFNDTPTNLQETATFMSTLGLKEVQILPFHRLGESKYRQLGLEWKLSETAPPSQEMLATAQKVLQTNGIQCYVGHEAPF